MLEYCSLLAAHVWVDQKQNTTSHMLKLRKGTVEDSSRAAVMALSGWNMQRLPWESRCLRGSMCCSKTTVYFSALTEVFQMWKLPTPSRMQTFQLSTDTNPHGPSLPPPVRGFQKEVTDIKRYLKIFKIFFILRGGTFFFFWAFFSDIIHNFDSFSQIGELLPVFDSERLYPSKMLFFL